MLGRYYPTERLRERIDKVTSSVMENGLYEYFNSRYRFKKDIELGFPSARQHNSEVDDDDLHALNMGQMIRPLYIVIGLLILSILVFVGEIIVFKWKARCDREHLTFQFALYRDLS